jgi:Homeodomain-like domain
MGKTGKGQAMANKKFVVKLSGEERAQLTGLISKGKTAAKTVLKARILLKTDQGEAGEGLADEKICKALDTNVSMVSRVRETFVIQGLDAVLTRKQRKTPPVAPIFDGERQAQLIALACSEPPEGYAHWTLRLLAEHAIERKIVETAHFNTVGRALKKTLSNRT